MPFALVAIIFVIGLIIMGIFYSVTGKKSTAEQDDAMMSAIFWIAVVIVVIFGIVCAVK